MKKTEIAAHTFLTNYNCAQAVFSTFGPDLGIDRGTCMKLAAPFGAGMARNQKVCGAVTGALMTIGLKFGRAENYAPEDKNSTLLASNDFLARFKAKHNSIDCLDILGENMNTDKGMQDIQEQNLFRTTCVQCVKDAVEILELLTKNE